MDVFVSSQFVYTYHVSEQTTLFTTRMPGKSIKIFQHKHLLNILRNIVNGNILQNSRIFYNLYKIFENNKFFGFPEILQIWKQVLK